MVKNYGPKPVSTHQKGSLPPRIDPRPGLITGTECGFLDPQTQQQDNNEPFETSSGSESDVSADIPAHLIARQTVRFKREYKVARSKETSHLMPLWYDGAWVYPKHWPSKQKKKDRTVVARDEISATVKKVNRLEQAKTI